MRPLAILAFLAGAALTIFLLVRAGLEPVTSALASLGLSGLSIIALAHVPIIGMLGGAWWAIGRAPFGPRLPHFIWARAVRDAAAEALPFSQVGGYVIGARALSLSGAAAVSSGVSTFLDLVLEFLAKLPYVLLGLAILQLLKSSTATLAATIAFAIGLFALALVLRPGARTLSAGWMDRLIRRWPRLADSRQRIATALAQMSSQPAAISASLALHFVSWIAGAGETWLIFHLMGLPISLAAALVIDSLLGALRMVAFFVPGAIGVQEGGYVLLCGLFGLPPGAALAFSFGRRARDLLIAAPVLLSWQLLEGKGLLAKSDT